MSSLEFCAPNIDSATGENLAQLRVLLVINKFLQLRKRNWLIERLCGIRLREWIADLL